MELEKINERNFIGWRYSYVGDTYEGMILVKDILKHKFGYIDLEGREIIPCIYSSASDFSEGKAIVNINNNWYVINRLGDIVLDLGNRYEWVHSFHEGLAAVDEIWYEKSGYINELGEEVIPCQFKTVKDFREGKAVVNKNGRDIIIDKNGVLQSQILANLKCYDYIIDGEGFNNGILRVKILGSERKEDYMFVDELGNIYPYDQNLEIFYLAKKPQYLKEPRINENNLICYSCEIKVLNKKIRLRANSLQELMELKNKVLNNLINNEEEVLELKRVKIN